MKPSRIELLLVAVGLTTQVMLIASAWAVGYSQRPPAPAVTAPPVVESECLPCPVCFMGIQHAAYLPLVMTQKPTPQPTVQPTSLPTLQPTLIPTRTPLPTPWPTPWPTFPPQPTYPPTSGKKGIGGGSPEGDVGGGCDRAALLGASYRREWGIIRQMCTSGVKTAVCVRDAEQAELALSGGVIGGDTIVLGFNEPDLPPPEGSQMTPHDGATYWHSLTAMFPGRQWASPASPMNSQWIEQMYTNYVSRFGAAPRIDRLDFHCYSYSAERCIQMAQGYINLADRWGIDRLIVSETQIIVGAEGEAYALQETREWLNYLMHEPRIEWFAWFCGACRQTDYPFYWPSRLMNRDNTLTPFGTAFVEAR